MAHKLLASRVRPWPEAQLLPLPSPRHREKEVGTRVALEMDVLDGSPRPEGRAGQLPQHPPPAGLALPAPPISQTSRAFRQLPTQWTGTGAGGLGSQDSVLSGR